MVRARCGQKVVDRKTAEEQMHTLGLKKTIDRLATVNEVRCYGHVLRRDDNSVLRVAPDFEVSDIRKQGQPKKTWKKHIGRTFSPQKLSQILGATYTLDINTNTSTLVKGYP